MYPYIYFIPKEVHSRVIKSSPSPQITSIWFPKKPPLMSNCTRVTTKWCPYSSIGHKLNHFLFALQLNTCQRTFCKQHFFVCWCFLSGYWPLSKKLQMQVDGMDISRYWRNPQQHLGQGRTEVIHLQSSTCPPSEGTMLLNLQYLATHYMCHAKSLLKEQE